MTRIFADTSYYLALFNQEDSWHSAVKRVVPLIKYPIVTTQYVLVELGSLMSRSHFRARYPAIIRAVRVDKTTEIVPASDALFARGVDLFEKRPDKEWSLTDCISFVVMKGYGISEALSVDRDFEQAGFQLLIKHTEDK